MSPLVLLKVPTSTRTFLDTRRRVASAVRLGLRARGGSAAQRRLSLEIDGCQMEFRVGEKPGQVTMDYVQTGQVRGERQVAAVSG